MGEIVKARPVAPQPDPEQGISFKLRKCYFPTPVIPLPSPAVLPLPSHTLAIRTEHADSVLVRGTQVEDVEVNITGLTAEEIYRSIFLTVQARASAPSPAPPKPKGSVTAPVQGIDSPQ
jgi:hypothetical protein